MEFKYKALTKQGKTVRGVYQADDRKQALEGLKEKNLIVLDIKEKKDNFFEKTKRKIKEENLFGIDTLLSKGRRKRQIESLKEELTLMGYDEDDIKDMLTGFNEDNFDLDRFVEEVRELSEIQYDKVKAGRLADRYGKSSSESDIDSRSTGSSSKKLTIKDLKLESKVPSDELILFTEQLSILIETGVPLIKALETVRRNLTSKHLRVAIDQILYDLTKGSEFSEALKVHPSIFDNLYVSLVRVGESTGSNTHVALNDLVKFLKMKNKVKKEVKKAMAYPILISFVMLIAILVLNYFAIPRLKEVYSSMDFEMPWITRFIFALSENAAYILIGLAMIILVLFILLFRVGTIRNRMINIWDYISINVPFIRNTVQTLLMYQLTLTLAITLRNGISIQDSLNLVVGVVANKYLKNDISNVYYDIEKGVGISNAFEKRKHVTNIFKTAVDAGETSGKIDETVYRVSEYYEEELTRRFESLISKIQPISVVLLAIFLLPFILGVYMPLFNLTEQLGNTR